MAAGSLGRLSELAERADLPRPSVFEAEPRGYRHRARLAVRGAVGQPAIGVFRQGTHQAIDIPECVVHHPLVNRTAEALRVALRESGTRPYADRSHSGQLRYLQVVVERRSQTAQVVLIGNQSHPDALAACADVLQRELGAELHSLWWNGNPGRGNAILGSLWRKRTGFEAVREQIGGAAVFFPPGAFGQSHLALADRLVERVHELVADAERVAELYAGCGPIGLGLLRRTREVTFNERDPHGLRGLELGLQALPAEQRARARVVPGPAGEAAFQADVVIVDPPRKGLDAELCARLAAHPPKRLIYLSCGLDSFLRDQQRLAESLRLTQLEVWALFPYTQHAETLAVFERN